MHQSDRQLALVPLRSMNATEAVAILTRLQLEAAVDIVDIVRLVRLADGSIDVAEAPPFDPVHPEHLPMAGWRRMLREAFGTPPGSDSAEPSAFNALGASFVGDVRDVLPLASEWLALVARKFDADAVVAALTAYPATRVVYGDLPAQVLEAMARESAEPKP